MILSDIPPEKSGVASGTNSTARQVGSALGVAVIGSLLTAQTISHTLAGLSASPLPASLKAQARAGVRLGASNYTPPPGTDPGAAQTLQHVLAQGVTSGTRIALLFAVVVVLVGTALSFLIPVTPPVGRADAATSPAVEAYDAMVPLDPDPALVLEPD